MKQATHLTAIKSQMAWASCTLLSLGYHTLPCIWSIPVSLQWWWRTPWRSTGCIRSEDRAKSSERRVWSHETGSYCPGTSTAWRHVLKKEKRKKSRVMDHLFLTKNLDKGSQKYLVHQLLLPTWQHSLTWKFLLHSNWGYIKTFQQLCILCKGTRQFNAGPDCVIRS